MRLFNFCSVVCFVFVSIAGPSGGLVVRFVAGMACRYFCLFYDHPQDHPNQQQIFQKLFFHDPCFLHIQIPYSNLLSERFFAGHWKATGHFFGKFIWKILYNNLDLKGGGTGAGKGVLPLSLTDLPKPTRTLNSAVKPQFLTNMFFRVETNFLAAINVSVQISRNSGIDIRQSFCQVFGRIYISGGYQDLFLLSFSRGCLGFT